MTKLHILWVPALVLVMLAPDAMAQRRGGGAVSGGVRGAMVGGLVGGSEGAQTGAKLARLPAPPEPPLIGKLRGVPNIRRALNTRMLLTRISIQHRHRCWPRPHRQAGPTAATAPAAAATASGGEALIRKDGKPVIGITYPSDWKQTTGDRYVSAVSADGQAYSMIATLEGTDKQAGIAKVKQGLEKIS